VCHTHLHLACPKVFVVVQVQMHEEGEIGPHIVVALLMAVEVQA
jgi:hypothetical protein